MTLKNNTVILFDNTNETLISNYTGYSIELGHKVTKNIVFIVQFHIKPKRLWWRFRKAALQGKYLEGKFNYLLSWNKFIRICYVMYVNRACFWLNIGQLKWFLVRFLFKISSKMQLQLQEFVNKRFPFKLRLYFQ